MKTNIFLRILIIAIAITISSCGEKKTIGEKSDVAKAEKNTDNADKEKYLQLCDYTMQHGVNFCFFYREMLRITDLSIKMADEKFKGVYNDQYYQYQGEMYKVEKEKLFSKYGIADSLSSDFEIFGAKYCK